MAGGQFHIHPYHKQSLQGTRGGRISDGHFWCCCASAGAPLGTILNFLLQLGFREVGSPFALSELDDTQRHIAADMAQLGLLMPFT